MAGALANQFHDLTLDDIQINYADDRNANMKQVGILTDILTKEEERSDVVVFGEGNFTFSMALASRRGSWDGITSTRYEPISDEHPMPAFSGVNRETREACKCNGKQFGDSRDDIQTKVKVVKEIQSPPDDTWQFGVDATCILEELNVTGKVAWFQCPWETQANKSPSKKTKNLIAGFLYHMALKQDPGDYALVGIVNEKQCVEQYNLEELLGVDLCGPAHFYKFLGADKSFVRELLQYGYRYEGCGDDHSKFLNDHITLVFRRQVDINYKNNETAVVNHVDILGSLLCEEKSDVVVFGEGDFTFSTALASRRGSWDGIKSTRYEPISNARPRPVYSNVKEETLQYCISNGRLFGDASDVILPKVEQVLNLPSPPDDTWRFDVDATCIPEGLQVGGKVAWFQCPWMANEMQNTGRLVADFLEHMGYRQGPGDYSLVGIVNLFPYVTNYMLGELLGDGLANTRTHNYEFLGADQKFVRELLQYGYHHRGCSDRHYYFLHSHITLVFRRLHDVPQ